MLEVVTLEENEKWDSIVKEFKNHDIYYLSGYSKGFNLHGDGEPNLIYFQNKEIKAINVVMKRDIANHDFFQMKIEKEKYYDYTTPYGYGGFLVEGIINNENLQQLDSVYSEYCKNNNIISEFTRFHPVIGNTDTNKIIYEVRQLGDTITLSLDSQKEIWENITSKNRNMIRKAIKSGVEVYWGNDKNLIDKFIPMYNNTMDYDEATDYYYFEEEFYESIINDLKYESMFFYAMYEGKVISMAIILFHNKQMHYHLSASIFKYRNLAATNLLLYNAAIWGSQNGYKTFHLGGGVGSKEDGLFKFKKSFNKNSKTNFSIGKKIFDQDKYYKLVEMSIHSTDKSEDLNFFPKYRL